MRCPYCSSENSKVLDKRDSNEFTRRRRECTDCSKRYTTYEKIENIDLDVIKKDGRKEPFNPEKLRKGILKACEKRNISEEIINKALNDIETELKNLDTTEIESSKIGDLVMEKLKKLDEVAYIRFASVYKEFDNIKTFEKELETLKKEISNLKKRQKCQ